MPKKIFAAHCVFFSVMLVFICPTIAQFHFVRHDISTEVSGPYGLGAVDMNNDGRMDILLADTDDGAVWWRNLGNGTFARHHIGDLVGAWYVHGADVDGDKDIDVMVISPYTGVDQIKLWINSGSNNWSPVYTFPVLEGEAVRAADLDGDGIMEILGISHGNFIEPGSDLVYFKDYYLKTTHTKVMVDPDLLGAHDLGIADFDRDGDIDIIASGSSTINIYFNNGFGAFPHHISVVGDGALGFSLADVDGDGDIDIVAQARNAEEIRWYEQTPGLVFVPHLVDPDIGECWSVHAADLDGDGDMDITAASYTKNVIRAYRNNGSQSFTAMTVAADFSKARFEYPMDVDGDGDADIVGLSANTSTLVWFESVMSSRSLRVTSPDGGQKWAVGSAQTITWRPPDAVSAVKIELSTNNGASWSIITNETLNDGSYEWIVPNAISNTCLIRISDSRDGSPHDESNNVFSIVAPPTPTLTLLSPNGGETVVAGSPFLIQWTSTGNIPLVKLEFSTNGGTTWSVIEASTANDGNAIWQVPAITSPNGLVRIADAADGDPSDTSNKKFEIVEAKGGGFALSFDGVNDAGRLPDNALLSGGPGKSLTVEAWVKLSRLDATSPIVLKFLDGDQKDWGLFVSAGKLGVAIENNGDNWVYLAGSVLAGVWTHVAFTFDNSANIVRLYINGIEAGAGFSQLKDMPDTPAPVLFGANPYNGAYLAGVLDEVRIWNHARRDSALRADKNRVLTGTEPGLIGYWRFDEGNGQLAADVTSNGNHVQLGTTNAADASDPMWVISDAPLVADPTRHCLRLPDTTSYGNIRNGDRTHVSQVSYCFPGLAGDVLLSYQAYDIDNKSEVDVLINGVPIHDVPVTPANGWGRTVYVLLPDALVNDTEENNLIFDNVNNPPKTGLWGVRRVSVERCFPLPAAPAYGKIRGGDQQHADKVTYCFPGRSGDVFLSYQVYDIDNRSEVDVLLNGTHVLDVATTADEQWSGTRTLRLPDLLVEDSGFNVLIFDNTDNPPKTGAWGVREVTILDCFPLPSAAAYGKIRSGDQQHADKVVYCFPGMIGNANLTYEVYDIDNIREVDIRLNGTKVSDEAVTADNQWSASRALLLPDALVKNSAVNLLVFDNTQNPPNTWSWGVRNVKVGPSWQRKSEWPRILVRWPHRLCRSFR
ncbi:MAG: FG-GAP-like repeat-containing protein [candidate division KSB1 bacterium]|nr:FG-GAP-like repeat-containing protein [candidate division KSB1 bacterium]